MDVIRLERRAYLWSTIGYLAMAGLGIGAAALSGSHAILIDGAYSLVSFVMAILAMRLVWVVNEPGSESFHFGYAHLEPLLNLARGFVVLGICALAFGSAIVDVLDGGRPMNAGYGLVYAAGVASICIAMAVFQRRNAKRTASPMLAVDARNWFIDGIITSAVGVAFLVAFLIRGTLLAPVLPYVDPGVVILLTIVMIGVPLRVIRDNGRQVLQLSPDPEIQAAVRARVNGVLDDKPVVQTVVRMATIGRFFYVLVQVRVPEDLPLERLGELDQVREEIDGALADVHERPVADVLFTTDRRWLRAWSEA